MRDSQISRQQQHQLSEGGETVWLSCYRRQDRYPDQRSRWDG
jgi:hypothetical protein